MFVGASAMIAIIAKESDWPELSKRLSASNVCFASPVSIWESVRGLQKLADIPFEAAEGLVRGLLSNRDATIVPIDELTGAAALDVSRRYGRGFHSAALNMGDCFAYACAKVLNVRCWRRETTFRRPISSWPER